MEASSLRHLFISTWATIAVFILSLSSIHGGAVTGKSKDIINSPLLTSKIATNRTILVGPKEEFKSVQAAIDAVPDGNSHWIIIHLRSGIYREKVVIPESKSYIFLRGSGKGKTAIVWNDSSNDNTQSAAFTVWADNVNVFGISFKNEALVGVPDAPFDQSVATMVAGDKVAFYHCAFYSAHNTLFDYKGRHYYESCYIQGNIDFIFGRGQSIFQSCEIFVLADKRTKILGSITAQKRESADDESGFVFLKCKIYGIGDVFLGRAKGAYSRVIFSKTYISKTITPAGWTNWSYVGTTEHLHYGEHDCHGPGADTVHRVQWARKLTDEEVAPFTNINFINGKEWLLAYHY